MDDSKKVPGLIEELNFDPNIPTNGFKSGQAVNGSQGKGNAVKSQNVPIAKVTGDVFDVPTTGTIQHMVYLHMENPQHYELEYQWRGWKASGKKSSAELLNAAHAGVAVLNPATGAEQLKKYYPDLVKQLVVSETIELERRIKQLEDKLSRFSDKLMDIEDNQKDTDVRVNIIDMFWKEYRDDIFFISPDIRRMRGKQQIIKPQNNKLEG